MSGINYLSWTKQQTNPGYSTVSYAQSTTSMVADRFNIMLDLKSPVPVALSAQSIANCIAFGEAALVLEFGHTDGFVDQSCEGDEPTFGD